MTTNLRTVKQGQAFSGKEITVDLLSKMNMYLGSQNVSFRARVGPVGEAAPPSAKLPKGAFSVLMIGTDGALDCTIYDSSAHRSVTLMENTMVDVKGATIGSMRPFQYQKQLGGLLMVQANLYAGKYTLKPASEKSGDENYPMMEVVPGSGYVTLHRVR